MNGSIEETVCGVDKQLLTHREVAKLLNKHISTIIRWTLGGVRGHRLPRTFVGGRRHISRNDLIDFLRAINRQNGQQPTLPSSDEVKRRRRLNEQLAARGF